MRECYIERGKTRIFCPIRFPIPRDVVYREEFNPSLPATDALLTKTLHNLFPESPAVAPLPFVNLVSVPTSILPFNSLTLFWISFCPFILADILWIRHSPHTKQSRPLMGCHSSHERHRKRDPYQSPVVPQRGHGSSRSKIGKTTRPFRQFGQLPVKESSLTPSESYPPSSVSRLRTPP